MTLAVFRRERLGGAAVFGRQQVASIVQAISAQLGGGGGLSRRERRRYPPPIPPQYPTELPTRDLEKERAERARLLRAEQPNEAELLAKLGFPEPEPPAIPVPPKSITEQVAKAIAPAPAESDEVRINKIVLERVDREVRAIIDALLEHG